MAMILRCPFPSLDRTHHLLSTKNKRVKHVTHREIHNETAMTNRAVSFQALVEQAPVICYVATADDPARTIYIAPKVESLLGYSCDDWTSKPGFFDRCLHPDDRDRVLTTVRGHLLEGESLDLEYRLLAKNGEVVWVRDISTLQTHEDGSTSIHGVLLDISAQKRTEAALQNRDAVLERLIEASTRINKERTLKGVLHEVAESARQVIGCRFAALGILDPIGESLEQFVVSGVSPHRAAQIGASPTGKGILGLLIKKKRPIRIDNVMEHHDAVGFPPHHPPMKSFLGVPVLGQDRPYGNLYFTEKDGGGNFTEEDEAVAVMFAANAAVAVQNARLDEEAVQLLSDLQTMQRTRDRFYAMVNHELRNALTAVHGWSELLLRKAGPKPPRPVLETVESADYALQLLHDLLDLSRLEAEMLSVEVEATDVRALAANAVKQIEPTAHAEGVHVVIQCDNDDTNCTTDEKRVRQILVNLLSNAVRHSPHDSTVTVRASTSETEMTFEVIDEGEGIGPEEMAIIFDAYERASTSAGGGTGLGLTLSRRLARILGGDLYVRSQLGQGAHFTLRIPRHMERG